MTHRLFHGLVVVAGAMFFCAAAWGWEHPNGAVRMDGQVFTGTENRHRSFFDRALKSPGKRAASPGIVLDDFQGTPQHRSSVRGNGAPRRKIGTARFIDSLHDFQDFRGLLDWQKTADGGLAAVVSITSPEASGVRTGMIVNSVPQKAEFRFFRAVGEDENRALAVITGNQIRRQLQRNMEKDPEHPDARTFWSPTVPGPKIGMEIYLPEGVDPARLDMAVPFLSHLERLPHVSDGRSMASQPFGGSDPCQNDATCYPEWLDVGNAVAKMIFTENGDSYSCTGTLLNDSDDRTWIPYFLTAGHCIDSQTVASSLETHWFFESAECDGTILNPAYTVLYGGADLLWTRGFSHADTDTNQDVTFLKLNDPPPDGAVFAGWNTVVEDNSLTGVHHPAEDWKKISFGTLNGNVACYETMNGYDCIPSFAGGFLNIIWMDGGTEPGSSGSGLFDRNGRLVGTLLGGGGGACAGSDSDYSRFGAAYFSGNLSQWLDPPRHPVSGKIILTADVPDVSLPAGSDAVIYGTAAPNRIILESGARAELVHFPGKNTIQIQSHPDLFTVSRSGTVVFFDGVDGTVLKIPATTAGQAIGFGDGTTMDLHILDGRVLLAGQIVTATPVPVAVF